MLALAEKIKTHSQAEQFAIVGEFARRMEIISVAEFLIATDKAQSVKDSLRNLEFIEWALTQSGPKTWRGKLTETDLKVVVYFCSPEDFIAQKLSLSASKYHLSSATEDQETISEKIRKKNYNSEEEFFSVNQLQFIPAEMREGIGEVQLAAQQRIPVLR